MNTPHRALGFGAAVGLLVFLLTSCMTRQAVIGSVDGWYIQNQDQMLFISGTWAMAGLLEPFPADDPPENGKIYTNSAGDALVFNLAEGIPSATIREKGRKKQCMNFSATAAPSDPP